MSLSPYLSHCSHWGAWKAKVENGRITEVLPRDFDEAPSPIIQSVTGWTDESQRILTPYIREAWLENGPGTPGRGKGRLIPVSWDEALDYAAREIARVQKEHGPASVFAGSYGWTSCGRLHHSSSLLKRLMGLCGGYTDHRDTYSVAGGQALLRHVLGSNAITNGGCTGLDSIAEHSETMLIFGALTPRTAQNEAGGLGSHKLERYLRRLKERGVRIIHISPCRDDLPDWLGAEWVSVKPGTDAALLLALAGEVVKAGAHDQAFLETRCSGADRYLNYLTGGSDNQVKTADWAAGITGVSAEKIREIAGSLPRRRVMITMSWSLQRARFGEQPYWAALGLAAALGQIGLPGGGVGYGYGSLGGVGTNIGLARAPAISKLDNPCESVIPVARITEMLENPGGQFDFEGDTLTYPDVRMIFWAGGNPYHHHQDLNRLARAWERPETIIVEEPMWTATALRADIILPASTSLERNDLAGARRSDQIIAMHKLIEPVGQSRPDFEIFAALAQRLGVGDEFTEGLDEMGWLRRIYEEARADANNRFGGDMPEFDEFWREGAAKTPVAEQFVALEDFCADPEANPLASESGKIVLGSDLLAARGYADHPAHPAWMEPEEWNGALRLGDAGVFQLLSPQPPGKLHSQLDAAPLARSKKRFGRERVRMHPEDAAAIGVTEDQLVRLSNARGACLAIAWLSDDVRKGVVVLPTGSRLSPSDSEGGPELSGNPNVLTLDVPTSSFGQGCAAHGCLVRVTPEAGDHPDPEETFGAALRARTAGA